MKKLTWLFFRCFIIIPCILLGFLWGMVSEAFKAGYRTYVGEKDDSVVRMFYRRSDVN